MNAKANSLTRRRLIQLITGAAIAPALPYLTQPASRADEPAESLIIDTHQHMWDLSRLKLPWLDNAEPVLRKRYGPTEYADTTRGLNVRAVYMEVDVAPEDRPAEAQYVVDLCREKTTATRSAVIGGQPDSPGFAEYIKRFAATGVVRGVRRVLFSIPPDTFLGGDFVAGIRLLGNLGLSFDLCMPATLLRDGARLGELAPDTRFVLDHCGNTDVKAFLPPTDGEKPSHDADVWKRDMELLAKRPNIICKISGIVAGAPEKWMPEQLAPIVNHCLDTFGPDRVVFGGDWPVCLKRATLAQWVDALKQIVSSRPQAERDKLWWQNAKKFYALDV